MKRALLIAGGTVGGLGAVLSITPPQLGVAHGGVSALATGSTSPVSSVSTDVATQSSPTAVPQTTSPASNGGATSASSTPSSSPKASATKKSAKPKAPAATSPAASVKSVNTKVTPTAKKSTAAPTPTATKTTASSSPSATQTSSSPTPTQTPTPTPTPTPTKTTATPTPVASGVSGTFTGATYDASEGGNRLWGRVTVTVTLKDGAIANISAVQNPSSRSYNAFTYLTPAILTQKLSVKTVMSITPNALISQVRGYTGASYSCYAYWESLQSALSKAGL